MASMAALQRAEIDPDPIPQSRILIVDDEVGPRESLRMILSPEHTVLCAASGSEALEILRSRPVDLVTIDLNMPGIKGEELTRTIREELPDIAVIIITGYGSLETAMDAIRCGVNDYLTKPFDVVQVTAAVTRAIDRQAGRRELAAFLEEIGDVVGRQSDPREAVQAIEESDALQAKLRAALDQRVRRAFQPQASEPHAVEFLEVLAEAIESREQCMRGHARRVAFYSTLVGERLMLAAEARETLRLAAFLHDLGKVGLPAGMLGRQRTFDSDEADVVRIHAEIGARLVRPLGLSDGVAPAILHHHERWDGRGYPDGLAGEAIPLASRVIAIADAFDAMTSEQPHQPAIARKSALVLLQREAGGQFDPALVRDFTAIALAGAIYREPVATPILTKMDRTAATVATGQPGDIR